ncbi:MAG: bifunctional [glutamate--ammonia ligase]-adenylyl-L-tyrosine phosphorylase/[glutamate--ammonia-ligase] adenylyltransferase, partial [Gammaproteobacteria bacterium]|nr:bifunctional [glutamate--ammonia ligase]-adenylyl-L-tyrosine phosphorylase/[glutamate--ammonia-ligase] adenylyltransferase [Gammaproteobacteria bacterium]
MSSNQADSLALLCKDIPQVLHNKLHIHWDAWLLSCSSKNISSDPGVDLSLFGKILACSDFVASVCSRRPDLWFDIQSADYLNQQKSLDNYQSEITQLLAELPANNDIELMQCLRLFRNREMLRIAWRDLAGLAGTVETLRNLTELAEACVDQTLAFLYQDQCEALGVPCNQQGIEQKLIVLGMGKLGGYELNYSSDIDLIFTFPEEGETRGKRAMANSQFFIRLGQRFIKALNDGTADGFVFRVDMRLRPYGDSGPLVMSFAGMENYYQTQGRDWERYAMIKARVIGGDRLAGKELMQMLHPFVYRRYLDFGAFESIREMKALIDAEIKRKGHKNNIKLGLGGIREIEFIGQTYQLIRGGGEPELQERSILKVLPLLAEKGYVHEAAVTELIESYQFLRHLENRLQMYADQQTHNLPDDAIIQQSIALAMDYESWSDLYEVINFHRHRVHQHFNEVYAAPEFVGDDKTESVNVLASLWHSQLDESEAMDILQQQGVAEGEEFYRLLVAFRDSSLIRTLSGQAQHRLDMLMPMLLSEMVAVDHLA